jgi:chromosome segregation ATPase
VLLVFASVVVLASGCSGVAASPTPSGPMRAADAQVHMQVAQLRSQVSAAEADRKQRQNVARAVVSELKQLSRSVAKLTRSAEIAANRVRMAQLRVKLAAIRSQVLAIEARNEVLRARLRDLQLRS